MPPIMLPNPENPFMAEQIKNLLRSHHGDPHSFLGLHTLESGKKNIRLWRPGASYLYIELFGEKTACPRVDAAGLFCLEVPEQTTLNDYRIYHHSGLLTADPYTFLPTIGELDCYLFAKGVHYNLWKALGGRLWEQQSHKGVKFAVWAPSAAAVALVADFNHWDGRVNPMRTLGTSGIWEIFIPGLSVGEKYKFEIRSHTGELSVKADPYAYATQLRPATASQIADVDTFAWQDTQWLEQRKAKANCAAPINIYEVHLGSWKQKADGSFLNYREIAKELVAYCLKMAFTHIELMPIQEHPLDESWGYQVSGFYAATSRFGSPTDFQWLVNHCHTSGIGVILDWVPGHFPTDAHSLGLFDGTALYEHADPRQGFHPHWNTYIFNFARHEVSNFLLANALFWLEAMHVDGLRVDAVASMLYLDYGRDNGEWIPNCYGTKENLDAIEFFKHLNTIAHQRQPGCLMIAEESTAFAGVSHPVIYGGLGFDMKWNMGWMNDTLRYFSKDMIFRSYQHDDLTFGLLYAFSEHFILPLSHDECVHGKGSLLSKMPGDYWQKMANLRLLLSYRMCQPGKKLLFMGGEIGQWNEWNCKTQVEWDLLHFPAHNGIATMVADINRLYLQHCALWERDFDYSGFEWVDFADRHNSIICYLRKSSKELLLCIHNFTPQYHPNYFVRLENLHNLQEIFNSDAACYGGSAKLCDRPVICHHDGRACGVELAVAPLATMIFSVRTSEILKFNACKHGEAGH